MHRSNRVFRFLDYLHETVSEPSLEFNFSEENGTERFLPGWLDFTACAHRSNLDTAEGAREECPEGQRNRLDEAVVTVSI